MRSSTDAAPDPEAQRPPAPAGRACGPLPWALSAALLLLAAACAACLVRSWAAPGAPVSPSPGPAPSPRLPEGPELAPDARARLPDPPQGAFAQLVAEDVQLTEGPLRWYSDPSLTGVTLAPGMSYDKQTHELVVAEAGVYYVFLNLGLKRVVASNSDSSSGSVSVALHLQSLHARAASPALTLDLPLPSLGNSVSGFRGGLLHVGAGQRLGVHLHPAVWKSRTWQLSQATVLGLFRVATEVPAGLPL
ncbi:tumor necrosis factor ligand superfamily member 9 [Camelus bactrianus]